MSSGCLWIFEGTYCTGLLLTFVASEGGAKWEVSCAAGILGDIFPARAICTVGSDLLWFGLEHWFVNDIRQNCAGNI